MIEFLMIISDLVHCTDAITAYHFGSEGGQASECKNAAFNKTELGFKLRLNQRQLPQELIKDAKRHFPGELDKVSFG